MGFSPYGEYWREIRKICVLELFSIKMVQSYPSIREEEVAKMIDSISQSSASATPIDLTEKLFAVTASIIFRTVFGTRFQGSDFDHKKFHEVIVEAEATMRSFSAAEYFPYVGRIIDGLFGLLQRRERVFNEFDSFFQTVIDEHLSPARPKQEQEDLIDVLLKIVKQQTKFGAVLLTKETIKRVLLSMFLGGIDTRALTMVWAMAELLKRPKLMKKAQDEVRIGIRNKGKGTESDNDQRQYLKMITKETLRLHPPAPMLLPRETSSNFKINGYEIYPKMITQVNAWAIGRDPKYWNDPEEFIPERFIDSSIDFKGQNFEFLQFGSGQRVCPGIYMATTMMEVVLANRLYWFDWKLPCGMKEEDVNMEEAAGQSLTVSKKSLVPVKFYH